MELQFFGFLNKLGYRLLKDGLGKLVCGGFKTFFGASDCVPGKHLPRFDIVSTSNFDIDF